MAQTDSHPTTDPSGAPTPDEQHEMWLANVLAQEEAEDRANYERYRKRFHAMVYGEAA